MKKVLVLGGSGFIGRNIVKSLVKKKYYVTSADIKTCEELENFQALHKF